MMRPPKYDGKIEDPFNKETSPEYIARKIKEYFYETGLSLKEIADALDVTQSAISNQLHGRPFGVNTAKRWSRAFGFSINWLTTAEGPMFDKRKPANVLEADSTQIMRPKTHIEGELPVVPAWMFNASSIDIYKTIKNDSSVETLPMVPHFPPHDLFARCPGNAMFPKICKGDLMALALLPRETPILDNDIYVIDTETRGMIVRRIRDNRDGTLTCIPCNQDQFQPFDIYKFDVINIFRVVGVLIPKVN